MRSLGEVEFEYLMLEDLGLAPCRGAWRASSGARSAVRSGAAPPPSGRRVIFASPVYGLAVTGQMKTFIDRFSYIFGPGSSTRRPSSSSPQAW
jgi:hypothetical protein